MVIPVPDSGVPAALGFAEASGIPFELGIIRNHYVGRTFIEPSDRIRHLGVKLKHNANRAKLKGKRIVLVDDSIVRGTTSKKIVEMVRDAGATEVHFRIASPPTTHSCFYGVDTPNKEDLLAHRMNLAGMRSFIQADSLAFISMDHRFARPRDLFVLGNQVSLDRLIRLIAQAAQIEPAPHGAEFGVYIKEHDPQFTKHSPDYVSQGDQSDPEGDVAPAHRSRDRRVVESHSSPDRKCNTAGRQGDKAEEIEPLHKRCGDHFLE